MKQKALVALLASLMLASVSATTALAQESGDEEEQLTMYFVGFGGADSPFWTIVMKGAEDAGRQANVDVRWVSPLEFEIKQIVDLIDQAIAAQPDGIAMAIADPVAQAEAAQRAVDAGIPVYAADAPPSEIPADDPFLSYSGQDEYIAGREAADRLLSIRTPQRAVCSVMEAGNVALERRCQGLIDVMDEAGVPTDKLFVGTDPSQSVETLKSYLVSHEDADALLTVGSLAAIPALSYFDGEGSSVFEDREMLWGTFDFDPLTAQAISDGKILFTVDQQPYLRGFIPINLLALNARYGIAPVRPYLTGPTLVDASTIDAVIELNKLRYR